MVLKYGESRGILVNKSHAAVYAYIAYYTAWLKHHFPAEYMCSCMTRTAWTKIPALLSECKKISLEILPPDINSSSIDFSNIENAILFGFNDIKGVGNAGDLIVAERKANGNFHSVKDFIYRMLTSAENTRSLSQSVIVTLIESGAMDSFCSGNRAILLHGLDDFITISKKLYTKKKLVAKRQEELENMEALSESVHETIDEKAYKKLSRSIETAKTACQRLQEEFDSFAFLPSGEDISSKLQKEYEHLGAYLTGSPIAQYAEAISQIKNVSDIADLDNSGNTMICGAIKTLEIKQRKKDGKEFGIFVLFDQSDEIEVKCFTKELDRKSVV